jgi:hypothetical protein
VATALRFIAPRTGTVRFFKALNRSVTASINDLLDHTKVWLCVIR